MQLLIQYIHTYRSYLEAVSFIRNQKTRLHAFWIRSYCMQLLDQYIRSYRPYLEAISSIRIPRTRHAMVTET
jgi:hypothetical protein